MSSSSLSIIAFLSSTFLVVLQQRSKNKKKKDDSPILMDKKTVIELREKHFLKSVSVSYANSGPLLIVGVCRTSCLSVWAFSFLFSISITISMLFETDQIYSTHHYRVMSLV